MRAGPSAKERFQHISGRQKVMEEWQLMEHGEEAIAWSMHGNDATEEGVDLSVQKPGESWVLTMPGMM